MSEFEKYQVELCWTYDRKHDFNVIVGKSYVLRELRWICHKYSNDVGRQVETPGKSTILSYDKEHVQLKFGPQKSLVFWEQSSKLEQIWQFDWITDIITYGLLYFWKNWKQWVIKGFFFSTMPMFEA